ncbi:MAG: pyridoxamine 5'-phosphate oxidase [Chitinophagaceae bacterium]|nr:pyridoxamine 5'-phosphate oxidase [Chitinophagaceae bacterium]
MMPSIADIRKEYKLQTLEEELVHADPFMQFGKWWNESMTASIDEVNAMTLATASADGLPSARIVLLKGFDTNGFVFFTNYESFKGKQIDENPRACLVFFWKELERQVRITGLIRKVSAQVSNEYYQSRPVGSQIGAIISPQSQVIESRDWLTKKEVEVLKELNGKTIERPPHWGGYCVQPVTIEFWQGRPNRLHDRIQYSLEKNGDWKIERLAP